MQNLVKVMDYLGVYDFKRNFSAVPCRCAAGIIGVVVDTGTFFASPYMNISLTSVISPRVMTHGFLVLVQFQVLPQG